MHPTVVFDRGDPAAERAAREAFDRIVSAARDLGGTITGEHGVGVLKQSHLAATMDVGARWVHQRIKDALDPDHLLNPGRALP